MKNKYYKSKLCIFLLMLFITFGFSSLRKVDKAFALKKAVVDSIEAVDYIYLDLAAGDIIIGKSTYSGYIFVGGTATLVSDTHKPTNKYYIYQSNSAHEETTGGYKTETDYSGKINLQIPTYPRVKKGDKYWHEYVTNNANVYEVSEAWRDVSTNFNRTSTGHHITFQDESDYTADVTIDNIWSSYIDPAISSNITYRRSGGIGAHLISSTGTNIKINLKGDNRLGCVHYAAHKKKGNTIEFNDGETEGEIPGSLTVADFPDDWDANHWNAVIGAADNIGGVDDLSDGIIINSGVIYAGATFEDNCTAIGGGGNEYGRVVINNGTVTAVTGGTGTAIGGGIGYGERGGDAEVTINNGTIYAYNLGLQKSRGEGNRFDSFVPAAAIGGGGSKNAAGGLNVKIVITGGTVYAQSFGGAAIGGGGSANSAGGPADIEISGGTIIAKSTSGTFGTEQVDAGVSIGGGTGLTAGGSVKLNISGGILRTGSIGGGLATQKGSKVGSADVTITDGDITGQIIMAAGASESCKFRMDGGTIHDTNVVDGNIITDIEDPREDIPISYIRENGGAVFMNDTSGEATITGGTIENCTAENGGAIYMSGGHFDMFGGKIINNKAVGHTDDFGVVTLGDGGGVYNGGGQVIMSGGDVNNNTALRDGGGVYVAGNYHMRGGNVLSNKAVYGGGIYVNDGLVSISGGNIDSNTATESGGGLYISCLTKDEYVDILSGSVSNNRAKIGGGVAVVSDGDNHIYVTVGINCVHPNADEGSYTEFDYPTDLNLGEAHTAHDHIIDHHHVSGLKHSSCPQVCNNVATDSGGGFFLKSPNTNLIFYCVIEDGNIASGNKQCYDMDVQGGHVEIGDKTYDYKKDDPVKGNIVMQDSIYVEGGQVDIYGSMTNPSFTNDIVVEIENAGDYFNDHRRIDETIESGNKLYKVHYYENLNNAGSYTARQYPDKDHKDVTDTHKFDFTIMASVFQNPGYKIVSWNTKPDGTGETYNVNQTYNLQTLDQDGKIGATNFNGDFDASLLVLYAIWKENGYILSFNPNVSEGDSYTGMMEEQRVTVGILDGSQTISLNQFKRSGYLFIGWTLTATPSAQDIIYLDGQAITKDFTINDGETIILYANWNKCGHTTTLVYTQNENILTEECSACGGHVATATIIAIDCVYDANIHLASTTFSTSWLGEKPAITYQMAASAWDGKDNIDEDWLVNPKPLHAGDYTASITVSGVSAEISYTISRAEQATLSVPKIIFKVDASNQSVIEISEPTGSNIMYWITRFNTTSNAEESLSGYPSYQVSNHFSGVDFGFYYFFYAKKGETRDYLESTPSKSEAYLADGGNIVYINNATGIKVVFNAGTGNFEYTVSADTGYHLRNYTDNYETAIDTAKPIDGATNPKLDKTGITLQKAENGDGSYKYTVAFDESKVAYCQITLEFSGAVKNATVNHKVTDGEVFSDFNNKIISISNDSAFTAQFILVNYIPEEYTTHSVYFSKNLPIGTTIIMRVDGTTYWYYKIDSPTDTINLINFIQMGGTTNFAPDVSGSTAKTITYQFIVDFSKVTENYLTQNLSISLKLDADTLTYKAPNIPEAGMMHISLTLEEKADFNLSLKETNKETATIGCTYTASTGAASIWNGKKMALIISAPENVPADLTLTVIIGDKTVTYPMSANRQFIIPLGNIGSNDVKITINSNLFKAIVTDYNFTAKWYISSSGADSSPLNGKLLKTCDFTLSAEKDIVPSIRIDGTKRICHTFDTITVTVNYKGIPADATIRAYLQGKDPRSGKYVNSGLDIEIPTNEGASKEISFNTGQMDNGSYRIYVVVELNGKNICEVPYYFVIA